MTLSPFLAACIDIALLLVLLATLLACYRILKGPTLPDRIVAVDLFGVLAVALIALLALHMGQPVLVDAAIALALVAFFGTVAYARFVERRAREEIADDRR